MDVELGIEQLLSRAEDAIRKGNSAHARVILSDVLRREPRSEKGWLLLESVAEKLDHKIDCLERVFKINPNNKQASVGLTYLRYWQQMSLLGAEYGNYREVGPFDWEWKINYHSVTEAATVLSNLRSQRLFLLRMRRSIRFDMKSGVALGTRYSFGELKGAVEEAISQIDKAVNKIEIYIASNSRKSTTAIPSSNKRQAIPDEVKLFVWQRDGGRCVKCGSQENLEFDHIIPLSKGGANTARNLQLLCEKCNRSKGGNLV